MNPPRAAAPCRPRQRGFTLIELLVVMGIIGVLLAIVVPGLRNFFDGLNLTGSADLVAADLALARQTAIARGVPVEVRIYRRDSGNGLAWNTLALVVPAATGGTGADAWIGTPTLLSGNVMIDPGTGTGGGEPFSTLLSTGSHTAPTAADPNPPGPWTATEASTAPVKLRGLTYVAFQLRPDGSTDLPAQDDSGTALHWCLSLRSLNVPAAADKSLPAPNFACLVLDPDTGHVLTLRP